MRFYLLSLLLLFLSLPADAAAAEIYEEQLKIYEKPDIVRVLMNLEQEGRHAEIFERIRAIDDAGDMKEAILWLRGRVMADDTPDPRYALFYAESLLRIIGDEREENLPLMETAAMVYLYGHLTLAVDAQRCLEREASWEAIEALTEPFADLVGFYRALPEDKKQDILTVAMRLEDRVSGREPNLWICADGRRQELEDGTGTAQKTDSAGRMEDELFSLVEELELQPKFVSDRIWRERRRERRRAFAQQFR